MTIFYETFLKKRPTKPTGEVVTKGSNMMQEALRRDELIREQAKACKLVEGQLCVPWSKPETDMWGEVVVEKICTNYAQYGRDKWPEDDVPLIVTAFSKLKQSRFFCTPTFLVAK